MGKTRKFYLNKNSEYLENNYFNVLDDINLSISEAEKVAFLGHNGAGKSSFSFLTSRIPIAASINFEIRYTPTI